MKMFLPKREQSAGQGLATVPTQIQRGQESRLQYRELIWRVKKERRFYVSARDQYAYVWQSRRFQEDLDFWKKRLGPDANVKEVDNERAVRFYLRASSDFQMFLKAITVDLVDADFYDPSEDTTPEPEV